MGVSHPTSVLSSFLEPVDFWREDCDGAYWGTRVGCVHKLAGVWLSRADLDSGRQVRTA